MTVNAPSGTSNFSTETNFDYNTSTGWVTENSKRKVKLVENASISNYGTTATTQEYIFIGKFYNLDISQEQLANKSFTGIIYVSKKECTSKETLIPFSVDGTTYYAKKGMTWEEWVNSNLYVESSGVYISGNSVSKNGKQVFDTYKYVVREDIIIENKNYITNNKDITN
mgnify:CR=1 FL=1